MTRNAAWAVFAVSAFLSLHAFAADSDASDAPTLDFANGLYARQMYGPAATEYEKFLKASPDSSETPSALYRYADSLYFLKKYADAESQFRIFLQKFPSDHRADQAMLRLGSACYFQQRYDHAIKALTPLTVRSAEGRVQAAAWFYLAKSWEPSGKTERVVESYRMVVEHHQESEFAALAAAALGDHALQSQDLPAAARYYRIAAEAGKPLSVARESALQAAEIAYGLKEYAAARLDYERILSSLAVRPDEPEAERSRALEIEHEALAGLFHCDMQLEDWAALTARAEAQKARLAQNPDRPEILYLSALAQAAQKNADAALALLDQVLGVSLDDVSLREKALFKKAELLALKGSQDAALSEIEKVFALPNMDASRAQVEKARVLKALGRKKEALAAYEAALAGGSSSDAAKAALYEAALLDLEEKRPDAAAQRFEVFAAAYPDDPNTERALLQIIQIDLDAARFAKAARDARSFLRSRSDSDYLDIAFYKLGLALGRLKNFRASAAAFQNVIEFDAESKLAAQARYGQAVSLESARRFQEAIRAYETLLAQFPDHTLSTQAYARLSYLFIRTNQTDRVIALYEELLFNRPAVPLDPDGVFWLLQTLMDRGQYAPMNRVLDALPARFPGKDFSHEIQFFRGEAAMGGGDFPKAIEHYLKAVGLKPEGLYAPHAHLGLGLAHAALNENTLALTHFNLALKDDRDVKLAARARFELAGVLLREQKLEEAAKAYMFVAILYDDLKYTPTALLKAGQCFLAVGQREEAQKAFSELSARYPQSEAAQKIPARPAGSSS